MKPEQRQLRQRRSVLVSLLLTEHISHLLLVILLLTRNRYIAILMILRLERRLSSFFILDRTLIVIEDI